MMGKTGFLLDESALALQTGGLLFHASLSSDAKGLQTPAA